MRMCMRLFASLLVPVLILCNPLPSPAQTETATLSGRVSDPQGKVVPSAAVEITNVDTGIKTSTTTNDDGLYVVPNLRPGRYRVIVRKDGFKEIVKTDITLHVQDTIALNFGLEVGSVTQSITVTGGAPLVNTESAAVSTVVDQTYVKNMPLNGRSFQDLILLAPGVVTQSPQAGANLGATGEFSVNGQRTESNYYTVDGVSANVGATASSSMFDGPAASGSLSASTALGTTQALVSVDALQEFRVQTSSYSAEYGRNPGGQFAFETKSGANQWHGAAFDYLRNGFFDAQNWFNNYFGVPQPPVRQNDFGGTLGGPIRIPRLYDGKDKTFFFFSYEGLRLAAPQPASVNLVPDAALRASAPSPLNQALNAYPLPSPNGLNFGDGIAQFIGTWSNPSSLDSTSVRFDHVIHDKWRLFFRFANTTSSSATRFSAATFGVPSSVDNLEYTLRTYTVGASGAFSSRLSNELRFNYSSNEVTEGVAIDAIGGSTPVDLTKLTGLGSGSNPIVALCYDGCPNLIQAHAPGAVRQWNLIDTVSVSWGRHQFKFGADYRRLAAFARFGSPGAAYFYFDEGSVLTNNAFEFVIVTAPGYPLYTNFSAFAQDEWRVSQRLNLSLGLRWDVNPAPGVTQGLQPYTYIITGAPDTWTLAPQGTALWQTSWQNFAPRLGVAYILHSAPGRETVVRGGFGVFYDTGQQLGSIGLNGGPGFSASTCCPVGPFPTIPGGLPVITNPPVGQQTLGLAFDAHLQLPYTLQWNASIEQELGSSQTLSVSYVASHADRLLERQQYSTPSNPEAANFDVGRNGLTSDYQALQLQFQRRLRRGFAALASYTWSHCLDYGSTNASFGFQRGNCDFDVRHNLSGAFSYDVPNVGHNGFADAVLHHWGLDDRVTVRTAFPVNLSGGTLLDPTGRIFHAGLNFVQGQPVYLYGANCASVLQGLGDLAPGKGCPGGWAINPNAFEQVSSGFGNVPRNFARGFGAWQMNVAVRRDFPIHEQLKLQFRAEAFNIFNHPNFGRIDPNCFGTAGVPGCPNSTFGQATSTLGGSLGVLNSLYQTGGPRSMQFALKLVF